MQPVPRVATRLICTCLLATASLLPKVALAQKSAAEVFPAKPVVFIHPLAAGGPQEGETRLHLSAEFAKMARDPEIARRLRDDYSFVAVGSTPEEFRQYIAPQFDIWNNLVKETGIKLEE